MFRIPDFKLKIGILNDSEVRFGLHRYSWIFLENYFSRSQLAFTL